MGRPILRWATTQVEEGQAHQRLFDTRFAVLSQRVEDSALGHATLGKHLDDNANGISQRLEALKPQEVGDDEDDERDVLYLGVERRLRSVELHMDTTAERTLMSSQPTGWSTRFARSRRR